MTQTKIYTTTEARMLWARQFPDLYTYAESTGEEHNNSRTHARAHRVGFIAGLRLMGHMEVQ